MALTAVFSQGCGKTGDTQNNELEPALQQAQSSALADGEDFKVVSPEAEKALNAAVKSADSAYPLSKDSKRSFGYIGTSVVDGRECYCFKVFDSNSDTVTHVADVAVGVSDEKVLSRPAGGEYTALQAEK